MLTPSPTATPADMLAIGGRGGGAVHELLRVLTLQDYNTRVVVLGSMLLGLVAGVMGTYMLLRRRALVGDALSHATLPGIAMAFIVMVQFGRTGKSLPGLLLGATIAGLLGVACILLIQRYSRIKEDAALGIVLSVFFGLGIVLLGIIQRMPTGNQAGLESFIYGKTASMLRSDALLIGGAALVVILLCMLMAKEFMLLSFDPDYAGTQGWPVGWLDVLMMLLVTTVIVIGLQAVGLILVIALLIIPPAAARFWTDRLSTMLVVAGAFGAVSGLIGASISALAARLPAGAIIVLVAATVFIASMLVGPNGGMGTRWRRHRRLTRRVGRQHLLRAIFEWDERAAAGRRAPMPRRALLTARVWTPRVLGRWVASAGRDGLVELHGDDVALTERGWSEAARVVREHRLWELYLITHADIAPSHVDRDADQIEHVLGPAMIRELESLLNTGTDTGTAPGVPPSPHMLSAPAAEGTDP